MVEKETERWKNPSRCGRLVTSRLASNIDPFSYALKSSQRELLGGMMFSTSD